MDEHDQELGTSKPTRVDLPSKGLRYVITIGGGRGGVGKSLLTVNLGVYLAQLGREVLITDADLAGSSLHIQLGLERAPLAATDEVESLNIEPVATSVPGLRLLPSARWSRSAARSTRSRCPHRPAAGRVTMSS